MIKSIEKLNFKIDVILKLSMLSRTVSHDNLNLVLHEQRKYISSLKIAICKYHNFQIVFKKC